MLSVAILAGGIATRLRPITEKIPKALVQVGGEPFIFHQLRLLKDRGFSEIVICAWYRGEMIQEEVGNGAIFDLDIRYSFDGDTPLGTAGAIKKAIPILGESFFVLYGDSYLPCNYSVIQEYFLSQSKPGLMSVYKNDEEWDKSNIEFKNGNIIKYDKQNITSKMQYIDYGLGLFRASVFDSIKPDTNSDLVEIVQRLLSQNQLAGFEVSERYYEIGSFEGLKELDDKLLATPRFALGE